MIRISGIKYSPLLDEVNLPQYVKKQYKLNSVKYFKIIKKSVDARKKNDINFVYTVDLHTDNEEKLIKKFKNISRPSNKKYILPKTNDNDKKIVIVGFGPAGFMCAYALSKAGFNVIVLERGERVDDRQKSVLKLKEEGILNPDSNIQFGEGGAGTFSDGKLTTGVNDMKIPYILEEFSNHGAPKEIQYLAKPHIGTDNLVTMVKSFREDILSMGGDIRFSHKLTDISILDGKIQSVTVQSPEGEYELETDYLVAATGHSSRDVFKLFKNKGINMERKVFAVGVRIEHLQNDIGFAQYGDMYRNLPPADYKLSCKTSSGRSVYTFCMCPGGEVVAAASEDGGVVTNGMSVFARDSENANSALLVNVMPSDFDCDDVLAGCEFQRAIERKAFDFCGGNYNAPCQSVGDFLHGNNAPITVTPSYKPEVKLCKLTEMLPEFVTEALKEALPQFDKKINGFAADGAVLIAPETRSSSPVRIIRDDKTLMSNISGIYPCGEGAGYAGGIMTAACDGLRVAEAIIERGNKNELE